MQAQIREIVAANRASSARRSSELLTAEDGSNPLVAVQEQIGKAMLESEERHRAEVETLRESHAKEARAMQRQIGELREEIARLLEREDADERVAEAEEAGTAQGLHLRGARPRRRSSGSRPPAATAPRHTGDEGAEGGGKKGDTLVELGAAEGPSTGRIVFEAKDKKLSKNAAWDELNEAMDEARRGLRRAGRRRRGARSRPAASSSPSTRATS